MYHIFKKNITCILSVEHIFNFLHACSSYYTMDCFEIQKNSTNGQYWANASHYLYCTEAHGQAYFFDNIEIDLNKNVYPLDKLVTVYSKALKIALVPV